MHIRISTENPCTSRCTKIPFSSRRDAVECVIKCRVARERFSGATVKIARRHPREESMSGAHKPISSERMPPAPGGTRGSKAPGMTPDRSTVPGEFTERLPKATSLVRPLTQYATAQELTGVFRRIAPRSNEAGRFRAGGCELRRAAQVDCGGMAARAARGRDRAAGARRIRGNGGRTGGRDVAVLTTRRGGFRQSPTRDHDTGAGFRSLAGRAVRLGSPGRSPSGGAVIAATCPMSDSTGARTAIVGRFARRRPL